MKPSKSDVTASVEERKALIEQIFVEYPRFVRARNMIAHCRSHSKISAEPECLLITGWQGAGKTTLSQSYARNYPRQITEQGVTIPVLSTTIPVPATTKSLVSQLLFAMGEPVPTRGTTVEQTLRLRWLMDACGVELVILDEFQHFIDRDSNSVLTTASNWLKNVLNETARPFVLLGMPYSELILRANPQLERRFITRLELHPFGWKTVEERDEFRTFLACLDRALPLPRRSGLSLYENAFRIYCATSGYVGYVTKLIRRAASLAVERSEDSVGLALLAEAYIERVSSRTPQMPNPFTVELKSLQAEPHDDWHDARKKLKRLLKELG